MQDRSIFDEASAAPRSVCSAAQLTRQMRSSWETDRTCSSACSERLSSRRASAASSGRARRSGTEFSQQFQIQANARQRLARAGHACNSSGNARTFVLNFLYCSGHCADCLSGFRKRLAEQCFPEANIFGRLTRASISAHACELRLTAPEFWREPANLVLSGTRNRLYPVFRHLPIGYI